MGDFICFERHLEALGISGDSSRCMTIDAFDLWKVPRRADDLIWLLSDHADAS